MCFAMQEFLKVRKESGEETVSHVFPVKLYATIRLKELALIRVFAYNTCWTSTK
jgi:hypothetical protein